MKQSHFKISLFLLCFTLNAHAQKLYDNKFYGPYILLYKLSSEQMAFLAKNPQKIDSSFLYSNLVGKVFKDSIFPLKKKPQDKFPIHPFYDNVRYQQYSSLFHIWDLRENGYFIEVEVNSLFTVNYRLIENPIFRSGAHKIGYESFVFVEDSSALPVYDAVVHLDTSVCKFDSSVGGYRIPGKKLNGLLKIERGSDFTLKQLVGTYDRTNNSRPPKDNYTYANIKYQGYLISNKPRYKTWDTLFFKSFLVNKKGKPIKQKLSFYLTQDYNTHFQHVKIKPKYKGDYSGYFIVTDSFFLDRDVQLNIRNKKGHNIKNLSVYLENYVLNDIQFDLKADKTLVTPGGSITFYATATNANHLPIMDGKLTFNMKLNHVNYTDQDSVAIPFQKFNNWFTANVLTDPSGVTMFQIPDSVFIPLDGTFDVSCKLLTSDNDLKTTNLQFNYATTRDRLDAKLYQDTLKVKRLYKMKSIERTMRLKLFSSKELIGDLTIKTPYSLYLPPNVYMAQLFSGDTLSETFYRQTTLPEVWGSRTHDSVHIFFKSKFDIPVFYRIYANNKLVYSGKGTALAWNRRDLKKSSYHIQYGILEGSVIHPRFYMKSFHLAEKELSVRIIQPEIIYPGQEVAVDIEVKNAFGKPVRHVNLAAFAVNMQIPGITPPDIPYMGLVKPQKQLPLQQLPMASFQNAYQSPLQSWQLESFRLYENAIFKLAYPKKGLECLLDTTPQRSTEIEFYAHGQGGRQSIAYVLANDSLIYFQHHSAKPGVFKITPGHYNFTIRTFKNIYTFKNVEVVQGFKNFICLQLDSLHALHIGDTLSEGVLTEAELKRIAEQTLVFRFDYYLNDTFILKRNGRVIQAFQNSDILFASLTNIQISTPLYNPDKSIRKQESKENFKLFGPINKHDTIEISWKHGYSHVFVFEPGFSSSFTRNDRVVNSLNEWGKEIKWLQGVDVSPYRFNSFCFDPYFKDTVKRKLPRYDGTNYPRPKTQLAEFHYVNYRNQKKNPVLNSLVYLYFDKSFNPKRLWMFNLEDSSFSILQNSNILNYQYPAIGMGSHRNLWTYTPQKKRENYRIVMEMNDSLWFVKNIVLDSSVHFFLTLKNESFRKLGQREHLLYDRLAKNLTKQPLTEWVDTPTVNKGLLVFPVQKTGGKSEIEGTVIGPAIKYPVKNAFIVLEKNGYFVCGAISNNEGRFSMLHIQPGIYMLKIKGEHYTYFIHYQLEIKAGYKYLVQAQLKPFSWIEYSVDAHAREEERMNADASGDYNRNFYSNASKDVLKTPMRGMNSLAEVTTSQVFRGNRSDGVRQTVDGVAVIGKYDSDGKDLDEIIVSDPNLRKRFSADEKKLETQRLSQLANDSNAQKTRKFFRDYAYWIPTLYTNKQGKAGFVVKYPDNATSWLTFVPAMDGKRHTGLGQLTVKSYKPISSSLALPDFLTEGDTLLAFGRLMNYTGLAQNGKYHLKYEDHETLKHIKLENFYSDSLKVLGKNVGDTLHIEVGFELANGYRDAESRMITVNSSEVISGKSFFMEIKSDTTLILKALKSDLGMDLAFYNTNMAMILELIGQVEAYESYDNMSLANYLTALLIKKSVCKTLKMTFTQEREIKQTMSKIKKCQDNGGWFGWFNGSKPSYVVSTNVAEAMFMAHSMGYENNTWLNTARRLESGISSVSGHERLEYLIALKTMQRKLDYDSFFKSIKVKDLDISGKLRYYRLNQLLGRVLPYYEINNLAERTSEGNLKIAGSWVWERATITDDATNTYNAWQILFESNVYPERRKALLKYLTSECTSESQSKTKAARAMLLEAEKDSSLNKDFRPQVMVNGQEIAMNRFPIKYHLKPGDSLILTHKNSPIYLAANRKYKTYTPISDPTQFDLRVETKNQESKHFKEGKPFDLKVTTFAKRNQYNCVIEIPIPAGCVYAHKVRSESPYELHREYKADRVLIFCDELPFGYHQFTVPLVPKFKGNFYTSPARVALMFYPDKAAFTEKKRWVIGK